MAAERVPHTYLGVGRQGPRRVPGGPQTVAAGAYLDPNLLDALSAAPDGFPGITSGQPLPGWLILVLSG